MYHRKIIHISGEDSPNVRLAKSQIAQGLEPDHEELIPGLLNYREYLRRKKFWDPVRKTIGLFGEFYRGAENLLYPPTWLDAAEQRNPQTTGRHCLGTDPGEGRDKTSWAVVNDTGLRELVSKQTPDTTEIRDFTLHLMEKYSIDPSDVCFDRGGGGKQHADYLREALRGKSKPWRVRTVAFGGAPAELTLYRRLKSAAERTEETETKSIYKNRRAEMYHILRLLLDPVMTPEGFALPEYNETSIELRRQLSVMPLLIDREGQYYLPPKDKGRTAKGDEKQELSLRQILGCSPDEADAVVLAVFALVVRAASGRVGGRPKNSSPRRERRRTRTRMRGRR